MKFSLFLATLALLSCSHQQTPYHFDRIPSSDAPVAMFSPWEGTQAFDKMYQAISNAKQYAKVTVYSWSDPGFDKAVEAAVMNGVNVRVVLHPDLASDATTKTKVAKLEGLTGKGKASFKIAPRNMHEKFAIIDGTYLINSSANMSGGAKTKYSENFVFLTGPQFLITNFENEFAVIWNSGKDIISSDKDRVEERLPYDANNHQTLGKDVTLYSSSMNYNYDENASSDASATGRYIKLSPIGGGKGPYTVRDAIINGIKNAKSTIYCSFNHFNILDISKALVEASARGVDVKLTVDNQEFREKWSDKGIEMTPYFVENWKKLSGNSGKSAPVRVKFYSQNPSPALWLLNHHKFLLIDAGQSNPVLFTGSYNLSETAEHNQFDNMVTYKGSNYAALHKSFNEEFAKLWNLERFSDKPSKEAWDYFTVPANGVLPIHSGKAFALTFEEIIQLRDSVNKIAPDFLRQMIMKNNTCKGFDVNSKTLVGCH